MKSRWPIILFVTVLLVSFVLTAYLVRAVNEDLRALATADNDNISWNLSQLEVETLNLQLTVNGAQTGTDADLAAFLKRFDIFYSRIGILTQSRLRTLFEQDPEAVAAIDAFSSFLEETTPIVDGPRAELVQALPVIQNQIDDLRPKARDLALAGIQTFAEVEAKRRADLSQTLIKLAASVLGFVLILIMAVVVLKQLFRQGQRIMQENEVVRSRFEAAIASSLDAVLVVDTSGKIVEFNGAAATVFGYEPQEALGQDMAELIVPDHMRDMHTKGMNRFLETGEKKVIDAGRVRLEAKRKSGEIFPVELSISLSETDGERVFVSYLRDITAEIKAVDDLRAARDKARQGEKAKADLLTVMSHEMRTPLNGILGSLSLIDQTGLKDRQKQHLKSIAASGELLLSHVNDVLDLSSLSSDARPKEKSRFDLKDVLESVSDSLQANAEARGNTLQFEILSDGLRAVEGFKTGLQQCLMNLVGNAIKFTSDGTISVEVERLSHDDLVEIRVADTGAGIDEKDLDRIFEEFVTIDAAFDRENTGTGLGLAITSRLAETMGGDVSAESVLGEGSLFTLRVPLVDAHLPAVEFNQTIDEEEARVGDQIAALVVDDNEINRMVLTDMLRAMGVHVTEAEDGYSALEVLTSKAFDVVFLDISMPGIDGIETLHRIRQIDVPWKDVATIAVTAHAAKKDHEKILHAPFADLVVKPFQSATIKAKMLAALDTNKTTKPTDSATKEKGDFESRFGTERYQRALAGFHHDLSLLADVLRPASLPSPSIREMAHKAAGSAAVLGEADLWSLLAALETANDKEWHETKKAFLDAASLDFSNQGK